MRIVMRSSTYLVFENQNCLKCELNRLHRRTFDRWTLAKDASTSDGRLYKFVEVTMLPVGGMWMLRRIIVAIAVLKNRGFRGWLS
jgi:hypothetical protein